ncbi:DUF6332 family protein [Streptomyces sp. NPDC001219]
MRHSNEDEPEAVSPKGSSQQVSRDAVTVEIVYSVITGAIVAALLFFAIASPSLIWQLSEGVNAVVLGLAMAISAAGFLYRVISTLGRLRRTVERGAGRD